MLTSFPLGYQILGNNALKALFHNQYTVLYMQKNLI